MTTASRNQIQPAFFDRPIGYIIIILAGILLWGFSGLDRVLLILTVISILFLLGIRRPVWAIGAFIISQLTITSYMVPTPFGFEISLHLLIMILTGFLVWRCYRKKQLEFGPQFKLLIIPAVLLTLVAAIANFFNSGFDVAYNEFRDFATGLMVLSFMPVLIRNTRDLKTLTGLLFVVLSVSSILGILQYFDIFGMRSATLTVENDFAGFRTPGMAESALELAYVLASAVMIIIGVVKYKCLSSNIRQLVIIMIPIMIGALYLTFTRSALVAAIFGLISIFLFIKTRWRPEWILISLLLISGFMVFGPLSNQHLSGRTDSMQEGSAIARKILFQASFNIAKDHPLLGIGGDKFTTVSIQYQNSIDSSLITYEKRNFWSYRTLGNEAPHNDFLNLWVSYGIIALIAFLWLFIAAIRILLNSFRISRNSFLKGISLGLAAAIVAYGINAVYHNLFSTFPLFWILTGFALTVSKLSLVKTSK